MHIYNDLYGHALAQEPLPRRLKLNNFGRSFLGHHLLYTIYGLSDPCPGVERESFREIHKFYTFTPNISLVMKFTIFRLPTLQMLHTKFGSGWPSSS